MKITVANYSGFCYGVERAVELSLKERTKKTYSYGSLIHNDEFLKKMKEKNIEVIEDLSMAKDSNLIIRSHGVPKKVYEEAEALNIHLIDATCPYVRKIHKIVQRDHQEGRKIIIIGDENHPEIIGINGWCKNQGEIIKNINFNLSNFEISDKITVVCQTTYKEEKYLEIKNKLSKLFKDIIFYDTICSATSKRQKSAVALAKEVDLMIVVGGKNSSNTNKLYELCCEITETWFVQNKDDYKLSNMGSYESVGIIGGASTPDWVINNIIYKINEGEVFVNGKRNDNGRVTR